MKPRISGAVLEEIRNGPDSGFTDFEAKMERLPEIISLLLMVISGILACLRMGLGVMCAGAPEASPNSEYL